jgi:hypothetical protein
MTAKALNLKPHLVGFTEGNRVMMHSAGDIEGHFGTDSRFYLIDLYELYYYILYIILLHLCMY